MNNVKQTSNRLWFPIIFFSLLIAGAFGVLIYFGITELIKEIGPILQANAGQTTSQAWDLVLLYYPQFWYTVFAAMLGFALIIGLLSWLFVRSSVRRRLNYVPERKIASTKQAPKKDKEDLAERRMFLHLFSMMQREGRYWRNE